MTDPQNVCLKQKNSVKVGISMVAYPHRNIGILPITSADKTSCPRNYTVRWVVWYNYYVI